MDPKKSVPLIPPVDDVAVARPDAVPEVHGSVEVADNVAILPGYHTFGDGYDRPNDVVDHPHHYQGDGMESIDVIEAFDLDFCLGNTVKYVLRAGKKDDEIQDLRKAIWYLNRRIQQLEKANQ